jgi:hypothetical protein
MINIIGVTNSGVSVDESISVNTVSCMCICLTADSSLLIILYHVAPTDYHNRLEVTCTIVNKNLSVRSGDI